MQKCVIIYSSTDGHTQKISEKMSEIIACKYATDVVSVSNARFLNLSQYALIVLGASIRYGKHSKDIYNFINSNQIVLEKTNNAFFSVNAVARKQNKNTAETNPYLKKFLQQINWKPKNIGVFAGKISYKKYGILDKLMIKLIMRMTKGPTDESIEHEFTNWAMVNEFAKTIARAG